MRLLQPFFRRTAGKKVRFGEIVQLRGRAVDSEDGPLTGESLIWNIKLLHNDHLPSLWGAYRETHNRLLSDIHRMKKAILDSEFNFAQLILAA